MLYNLGDELRKLTWAEMNKIATHIANAAYDHVRDGKEVDPHFVSELLVEIGEDIVKEAKTEATALQPEGSDTTEEKLKLYLDRIEQRDKYIQELQAAIRFATYKNNSAVRCAWFESKDLAEEHPVLLSVHSLADLRTTK